MRVLHCIAGLTGDGAQRMLLRLATCLQNKGIENHVVSLHAREPLADLFEGGGIPVHSFEMRGLVRGISGLRNLRCLVRQLVPDVLQGWMYHGNLALALIRPSLGIRVPLVWNIRRGLDDLKELKIGTRAIIRVSSALSNLPDQIIFCTAASRRQHQAYGFAQGNEIVLGNGFDTEVFAPRPGDREAVRSRFRIGSDEIVIGNVGRWDIAKGREFLLEAFAGLMQVYPHARLMLVGRGLVESNQHLMQHLHRLNIRHRVVLVGECAKMPTIFPAMDILCSSSIAEGFPNVIAEAMASEIPVVATDTGNVGDLIEGIGILVAPRSVLELARGLVELCGEGQAGWRRRGRRSRKRIESEYSLDRIVEQYNQLYTLISAGGGTLLAPLEV